MITITAGFGGTFVFERFTSLAPSLVTENLSRFWDLARPAQVDTLASAYQHLSGVPDANPEVLASVGQMTQRLNDSAETSPVDHLVLGRLLLEWGRLKSVFPPSSPPQAPRSDRPASSPAPGAELAPRTPVPPAGGVGRRRHTPGTRAEDSTRATGQFYRDGKGGYFPPSWAKLSDDMKRELKSLAWSRKGKMSDLTSSHEMHASLLLGAISSWVVTLKTVLMESGVKGAGQSGLASAPSVQPLLSLISEMTSWMGGPALRRSALGSLFWEGFGAHEEARMAINRLTTMRTLQSSLEQSEKDSLERTLYTLDGVYLTVILAALPDPEVSPSEAGRRDEAYGDTLAQKLGEAMIGLPLSERTALEPAEQVRLADASGILRIIAQEARADPASPAVKGFLKRLNPAEILRLQRIAALIAAK